MVDFPFIVTAQEDGTSVYKASFMNWVQAVKEIDVIAKKARTYTITLTENAGDNGTIGTLTMPALGSKIDRKVQMMTMDGMCSLPVQQITLRCRRN